MDGIRPYLKAFASMFFTLSTCFFGVIIALYVVSCFVIWDIITFDDFLLQVFFIFARVFECVFIIVSVIYAYEEHHDYE